MSRKLFSSLNNAVHCKLARGSGRNIVLFAFERAYRLISDKSASVGQEGALACWLNPDQLNLFKAGGASVF